MDNDTSTCHGPEDGVGDGAGADARTGHRPQPRTEDENGTGTENGSYWREPTRPHTHPFLPYRPEIVPAAEGLRRGREFHRFLDRRRSVRFFSDRPVPQEMIEVAVRAAGTAPSGAHQQPWTYVATDDPAVKHRIRLAAEREERAFYRERDVPEWHRALEPLETDENKDFLDIAPWLVVAFAQKHTPRPGGQPLKNYYVNESVGISCGFFIAALHSMGLVTLTHTPNPMAFLTRELNRPATERPYILFPVGYPAPDAEVPDLVRKPLDRTLVVHRTEAAAGPAR
jgi:iodotyrosine deiodinase